jgi:hypothetical protein
MKRSVQDGDFIIREYREADFNGYDVYIMRDIEKL